jgi:DNA-binding beta-propeller fold protein YncE
MFKSLLITAAFITALAAATSYHSIKKIPIPGDYGWDYLTADSEARRLYISHDKEVIVLDLDSNAILGKIPGNDVHGIAVVKELGRGFISATDPGSVTVFDLKTFVVIGKVTVGEDPNAIFYDRKTQHIFTIDRGSKRVSAIDPKTLKVTGAIENLGGRTEHAVSDDDGHIFLNMQDRGTMLKIDSVAMKVTDTWQLAPCKLPSSMDMDRAHNRVFVGCRAYTDHPGIGAMAIVDATNGHVVTVQPIGPGVDATEFNPANGLVYFSSGGDGTPSSGTMSVFHQDTPDKYSLVQIAKTQTGARTMALDQKTGRAYLSVSDFGPTPPAGNDGKRSRPKMLPGTFSVLVMGE